MEKRSKKQMDTASKASAIAVSRQGAAPSIPYLEEVEEYKIRRNEGRFSKV